MQPLTRLRFDRCLNPVDVTDPCESRQAIAWYRKRAGELFEQAPFANYVRVVYRATSPLVRYEPKGDEVLYVPSTGGRWGKRRMIRFGRFVR